MIMTGGDNRKIKDGKGIINEKVIKLQKSLPNTVSTEIAISMLIWHYFEGTNVSYKEVRLLPPRNTF